MHHRSIQLVDELGQLQRFLGMIYQYVLGAISYQIGEYRNIYSNHSLRSDFVDESMKKRENFHFCLAFCIMLKKQNNLPDQKYVSPPLMYTEFGFLFPAMSQIYYLPSIDDDKCNQFRYFSVCGRMFGSNFCSLQLGHEVCECQIFLHYSDEKF